MYKKLIFSALALSCSGTLPGVSGELSQARERGAKDADARATHQAPPVAVSAPVTLFSARSDFNRVLVQEEDGRRELLFEPSLAIQSSIRVGQPLDLRLAYTRSAMVALAAHPAPRRVLIVGLGGGAMPMFLRAVDPSLAIDVVEIDPLVVRVAREFMGFVEDRQLKVHVGCGRRFIEESDQRYDIVFLDAYGPSDIPVALTTVEFLRTVRARLQPNGIVAGNVWSPTFNELYEAMHQSYREAFGPHLCVLDAEGSGNRIFLARQDASPFDWSPIVRRAHALTRDKRLPFDLAELARPGCLVEPPFEAEALRDE